MNAPSQSRGGGVDQAMYLRLRHQQNLSVRHLCLRWRHHLHRQVHRNHLFGIFTLTPSERFRKWMWVVVQIRTAPIRSQANAMNRPNEIRPLLVNTMFLSGLCAGTLCSHFGVRCALKAPVATKSLQDVFVDGTIAPLPMPPLATPPLIRLRDVVEIV